jgi:hypothetical protein
MFELTRDQEKMIRVIAEDFTGEQVEANGTAKNLEDAILTRIIRPMFENQDSLIDDAINKLASEHLDEISELESASDKLQIIVDGFDDFVSAFDEMATVLKNTKGARP